jgi:predicted amidohydrolase
MVMLSYLVYTTEWIMPPTLALGMAMGRVWVGSTENPTHEKT